MCRFILRMRNELEFVGAWVVSQQATHDRIAYCVRYSEMKLSLALLLAGLVALGVADISRCVS